MVIALIGVLALVLAGVGALAHYYTKDPKISEEEAKSIAEEYTNGKAIYVELEREIGSWVYEVVVENQTGRWEVEIDADNGKILEVEEDDDNEGDDDDKDDHHDDDDDDSIDEENEDDQIYDHVKEQESEGKY